MKRTPLVTTPFYFRDLTYLNLPKGVSIHSREGDQILFDVNRNIFEIPARFPAKKLTQHEVLNILLSRGYNANIDTLMLLFLDTTNLSIKNRAIQYRIPICSGKYERLTLALTGSLYDEHRTIAGVLKMRSFCVSIYNDVDPITLTTWSLEETPHHDKSSIRIHNQ